MKFVKLKIEEILSHIRTQNFDNLFCFENFILSLRIFCSISLKDFEGV